MKLIFLIILIVIVSLLLFGLYRTRKTQTSKNNLAFKSGHAPDPLPDGFYKGSVTSYAGSWQGKTFNKATATGLNIFKENDRPQERYPFKTTLSKGLKERDIDTYKIDYNIKENPFWVRWVLDEIVETEPGHYLGKIHLRIIPGLPFSVGYFRLEK